MLIDLTMLIIIGTIIEVLGVYLLGSAFILTTPLYAIGLLMTIIALSRWGIKGMIGAPIFAIAGFIAGKFLIPNYINSDGVSVTRGFYNIPVLLGLIISYSSCLICLVFYKKKTQEQVLKKRSLGYGMIFCVWALAILLQVIFTTLFWNNWNSIFVILNRVVFSNIFSLILMLVLYEVLNSQKVLNDVKKKFLELKKEMKYEDDYYKSYTSDFEIIRDSKDEVEESKEKKED